MRERPQRGPGRRQVGGRERRGRGRSRLEGFKVWNKHGKKVDTGATWRSRRSAMAESTLVVEHGNLAFHLRRTARDLRAENPSFETFQQLVFASVFWLTATSFHANVISRTLLVLFFFLSVLGTPASLPRCQDIVYNPASRDPDSAHATRSQLSK